MKVNYVHLLQSHYPRSKWEVKGREYEDILWLDEKLPKPTKEYLDALDVKNRRAEMIASRQRDFMQKSVQERESFLLLDAEEESGRALESVKAIHEEYRKKIVESLTELKKLEEIKETARQEIDYFYELSLKELEQVEEAVEFLRDTDWVVIRETETGKEIPESIKIKRSAARAIVEKGEKVYKNYDSLQSAELPSIDDRIAAIRSRGDVLKRLKNQVKDVQQKYKKPRRRNEV